MPFLYYRHARLRHALVRNTHYYGWVRVDGQGFRGREVSPRAPAEVERIMVVGGSTTFDGEVTSDDRAWPARLEFRLHAEAAGSPVEVINAGVPGYRVLDNVIRLQSELSQFHPDVIVLYDAHNDLFSALGQAVSSPPALTDTPGEMPVITPWAHWLSRHSLLYNKIALRWKVLRFAGSRSAPRQVDWSGAIAAGAAQFERDVVSFVAIGRAMGIRVVLAQVVQVSGAGAVSEPDSLIRATWRQAVPFAPPDTLLAGYRRFDEVVQAVAHRFAIPYVSTKSFGLAGLEWYADGDPIHFNDRGADRMGRLMAQALVAAGVIGRPRRAEARAGSGTMAATP
jgi:lysophospholipase L1-like esterase